MENYFHYLTCFSVELSSTVENLYLKQSVISYKNRGHNSIKNVDLII